jgi:ribose 5-phosphate isomerase B
LLGEAVLAGIVIGADHSGTELKSLIIKTLEGMGHRVGDFGVAPGTVRAEYPEIAGRVSQAVAAGEYDLGVLVCGTGTGMSIAANKHKGIRCANCFNEMTARLARSHNDANILALGARTLGSELALSILGAFVGTAFEGGRHQGRLDMLE